VKGKEGKVVWLGGGGGKKEGREDEGRPSFWSSVEAGLDLNLARYFLFLLFRFSVDIYLDPQSWSSRDEKEWDDLRGKLDASSFGSTSQLLDAPSLSSLFFSPEKKTRVKDRDFNAEKNREIKVVSKVVPPSSSVNSESSTLSINSFPFPSSSSSHRFNAGRILLLLLKLTQIGLSSTSLPKLGWSRREDRGLSGLASRRKGSSKEGFTH